MKYTLFLITILWARSFCINGQEDEKTGFPLLYEEDFEGQETILGFVFSDPAPWFLTRGMDGGFALEYAGRGDYQPGVRSPRVIGLIDQLVLGTFVLEADVLQTSRDYGHGEMCIYFGFQDSTHFYYAQLATVTDQMAHNVHIVNDLPEIGIATERTDGVIWGDDQWHHIRLERYVDDGSIRVYFDDMGTPVLVANDKTFQFGYVGFGSFGDSGKVDNIRIWAEEWGKKKSDIFMKKY